ncbi:MAG: hypothetical protein OXR84_05365 [Magnetovibrio sp.]|nr:hypothetical protein [Magnetovibrio sp.]
MIAAILDAVFYLLAEFCFWLFVVLLERKWPRFLLGGFSLVLLVAMIAFISVDNGRAAMISGIILAVIWFLLLCGFMASKSEKRRERKSQSIT